MTPTPATILENPEFTKWLFGQSVAFVAVVLAMGSWIWTLSRQNTALTDRNEKLSDDLLRTVENATRERSKMTEDSLYRLDMTVRNMGGSLKTALETKPKARPKRSSRGSMPPSVASTPTSRKRARRNVATSEPPEPPDSERTPE